MPKVRPVALALQAKLSVSSHIHVRGTTSGQALPLDGSHLMCAASSSLRQPASRGGKRLEPKGTFEEQDALPSAMGPKMRNKSFQSPQLQKDLPAVQGCQGSL